MNNFETVIGKVESIAGSTISVELLNVYPSNMPIINGVLYRVGQIGSFIKIPLGYANVFGIVTQIGASAIPDNVKATNPEKIFTERWTTIVLVGEQVGNRFERGVLQSPTIGDEVHLVTTDDMDIVYGGIDEDSSIIVGNISASESLAAKLNLNKLVSRHSAILGSTGSGKSNTVTVLLKSIAERKLPSARILVIDPHGEYNESLSPYCKVFKVNANPQKNENEFIVPYWALPFDELFSLFPGKLSDQQIDHIRQKVYELKKSSLVHYPDISGESMSVDSPVPFSIKKLWFDLDNFERQTFLKDRVTPTQIEVAGDADFLKSNKYPIAGMGNSEPFLNNSAKGILSFLEGMRSRLLDKRFSFLFGKTAYEPALDGKPNEDLDQLFINWLCHDKPITVFDLSGIPSNIMQSLSGTVLKTIYDALFWGQNSLVGGKQQPLLVVLEEAHNYLKAGQDSISSRTIQIIAKEGRKYGVGLMLVTQRPSELDKTVLSQCGTMIALRMNNSDDRGFISSAMQDELQVMTSILSSLRTGEGIVSGEAVQIPSRIKFNKARNTEKGSNPEASKQWKNPRPEQSLYTSVVKNWRNQSFS